MLIADASNGLPIATPSADPLTPSVLVLLLEKIDSGPITPEQIITATREDPLLSQIVHYTQKGWPQSEELKKSGDNYSEFHLFVRKSCELALEKGIFIMGK